MGWCRQCALWQLAYMTRGQILRCGSNMTLLELEGVLIKVFWVLSMLCRRRMDLFPLC